MRKILLTLFILALIFTGCDKDDTQPLDFFQIQKIETNSETFNFQYNDSNLLSRFEALKSPGIGGPRILYFYVVINFDAQKKPVSADLFELVNPQGPFYRKTQITYQYDLQEKIACTVYKEYDENGNLRNVPFDTLDFKFDSKNRPVTIGFRHSDLHPSTFVYDANSNLTQPEENYPHLNAVVKEKYAYTYDNGNNPFAENGLGLTLLVTTFNKYFHHTELLSAHNPVTSKMEVTRTYNEGAQVFHTTIIKQYKNNYDTDGGLKEMGWNNAAEDRVNGAIVSTDNRNDVYKITSIKKQRK